MPPIFTYGARCRRWYTVGYKTGQTPPQATNKLYRNIGNVRPQRCQTSHQHCYAFMQRESAPRVKPLRMHHPNKSEAFYRQLSSQKTLRVSACTLHCSHAKRILPLHCARAFLRRHTGVRLRLGTAVHCKTPPSVTNQDMYRNHHIGSSQLSHAQATH
jgi:hypothetical protein